MDATAFGVIIVQIDGIILWFQDDYFLPSQNE
jgi:hypothetical protein